MPTPARIPRPAPSEFDPSYADYVAEIDGDDALAVLSSQLARTERMLGALTDARANGRYAPDKWSVKQVVGHLCDNERIYAYRALRFARGDATPLANFDENLYAQTGRFDHRAIADLLDEFRSVRAATISLFASFDPEALDRVGVARGLSMSVRALGWIALGHVEHHLGVLRARYGIALPGPAAGAE